MLSNRQVLARLALDTVAWCCLPAAFLFVYVARYAAPGEAVLGHMRLVIFGLLGLALLRLVLAVLIRPEAPLRLAVAVVTATLLAAMILYYGLVLVGLHSWGRVVTWALIASYAPQALKLADALEVSVPLVIAVLAAGYAGLLAGVWAYFRRFDWAAHVARHAPSKALALALVAGSTVATAEAVVYLDAPRSEQAEPVSLTFFPMDGARNLQGHAVDRLGAARLDAIEDAARAAYASAANLERKNVILIVVDALRADHMGLYGYWRDTTPTLSRLEGEGRVRKTAALRAVCSSSACGLLSIAASKFVHQFSDRPILLYEVLRHHGYRVHMILSGDHATFYGLKEAYGELDSYFDGRSTGRLRYMNDDRLVLERLSAFPSWDGVPVMLQFHLMSAHQLGGSTALFEDRDADAPLSARERHVSVYDRRVLQADRMIGELLESLERKGYLERAVVAITADHGEALGEHGYWSHANAVYDEMLRVPLLLISYGDRPGRGIDGHGVASQVDIAPTLLAELGMPRPATWAGVPLQEPAAREFTYFQQHAQVGLFDHRDARGAWKYWMNARTGEEHAFDLRRDPGEAANAIATVAPARAREWRRRVMAGSSVFARP